MKSKICNKTIGFLTFGALAFGAILLSPAASMSAPGLRSDTPGVFKGKQCEKCSRGSDGKMECVKVDCPK